MKEETTWSPGLSEVTPSPTSMTSPAASCPSTSGGGSGIVPLVAERSEWHTPHAAIVTSASPRRGASTLISSTTTGLFSSRHRTALALCPIRVSIIAYSPPPPETADPRHAEPRQILHRWPLGRAFEQRDDRRAQRRQRRSDGTRPRRQREGHRRRRRRGARRPRRLARYTGGETRRIPGEDLRRPQGARRRAGEDHRAGSRHAAQDGGPHPGRPADRELRELRPAGEGIYL